jgi:hypothetical protein
LFSWSGYGTIVWLIICTSGFSPLLLLGPLLFPPWERVRVDHRGVSLIRGLGPIIWTWRRYPPGGEFQRHEGYGEDPGPDIEYRIAGEEHELPTCRNAELVCELLNTTASRIWREPLQSDPYRRTQS